MLFSHVASFCLFSLSIGSAFASPSPKAAALVRRQDTSDILSVLNNLQASTNATLNEITGLVNSNSATADNISPLISQLTTQINSATSSLPTNTRRDVKRADPAITEIAQGLDTIVRDVLNVLGTLLGNPIFPSLPLSPLDAALAGLLRGVEELLAGVLALVAELLVDVAGLLTSLSFTLTASALGLGLL